MLFCLTVAGAKQQKIAEGLQTCVTKQLDCKGIASAKNRGDVRCIRLRCRDAYAYARSVDRSSVDVGLLLRIEFEGRMTCSPSRKTLVCGAVKEGIHFNSKF